MPDIRFYRHDNTYGSAGDMILLRRTSDTIPQMAKHLTAQLAVGQYRRDGANCSANENMTADRTTTPVSWLNGTILHSG